MKPNKPSARIRPSRVLAAKRLDRLPPYLFAELERKISEKRASGVDVISLGIGDPDTPTPAAVVEALGAAAHEPATHQYPSNRGRPELRQAFARFYERRARPAGEARHHLCVRTHVPQRRLQLLVGWVTAFRILRQAFFRRSAGNG